jgi:cytochrome c-type biogenesis protein CcmE
MRSRLRFVVALAVAVALGGWLAYTSLGGTLETYAGPADVAPGKVYRLNGTVAPGVTKDPAGAADTREGLTFTVADKANPSQTLQVRYRGSVPDQFREGREVVVTGEIRNGVFVARNDSLITLCPSKFTAADMREAGRA